MRVAEGDLGKDNKEKNGPSSKGQCSQRVEDK